MAFEIINNDGIKQGCFQYKGVFVNYYFNGYKHMVIWKPNPEHGLSDLIDIRLSGSDALKNGISILKHLTN